MNDKNGASAGNDDLIDNLTYGAYVSIARVIPASVTPNALTVANFACAMFACACLLVIEAHWALLVAPVFLYLYTLLDSLDGIHARQTGQTSPFGHFLDHFLDGFTWFFLYFVVLVRFELMSVLFLFLIMLRLLIQSFGFLTEVVTGKLYLPKLGPTCEMFGYCIGFIVYYFFPGTIDLGAALDGSWMLPLLERLDLVELNAIKILLLFYIIGLPLAIIEFVRQAHNATTTEK